MNPWHKESTKSTREELSKAGLRMPALAAKLQNISLACGRAINHTPFPQRCIRLNCEEERLRISDTTATVGPICPELPHTFQGRYSQPRDRPSIKAFDPNGSQGAPKTPVISAKECCRCMRFDFKSGDHIPPSASNFAVVSCEDLQPEGEDLRFFPSYIKFGRGGCSDAAASAG